MKGLGLAGFAVALLALAGCKAAGPSERAGLNVREDADRVVLHWNGQVEAPMRDRFAEALEKFENDPRRIVISLNSPGGSVAHGHEVIRVIRKASRERAIDTLVEAGKSCASMCVPIYLVGAERFAQPAAKFMFHEVSFQLKPGMDRAVRDQLSNPAIRRMAVNHFTNELFEDDFGPRSIDARWLEEMRKKIRGRDVWLTAKQLMQQGSGVVDRLL
jgi:ATP-dependent protease ClpP protease subunit